MAAVPPAPVATVPPGTLSPQDPPPPVVSLRIRVPAVVNPGQDIEYQLCVENRSTAAAHHVVLRNALPANAQFVRANPEPTSKGPGPIVWDFGTLAPSACQHIDLVLHPTGPGEITNSARVQFEYGECVVTRLAQPVLALQVAGPADAAIDDPLNCQVIVTNTGTAPASGVKLTLPLPDGLEPMQGGRELSWQPGTLAPGETKRFPFQVVARQSGELRSAARGVADNAPAVEGAHVIRVGSAQLGVAAEGPPARSVGEAADYKISVSNLGTMPAKNVVVTDFLPAGVAAVAASDGGVVTNTQVHWNLGSLPPGSRKTLQLATRAESPVEATHEIKVAAERGLRAETKVSTRFAGAPGLNMSFEKGESPLPLNTNTTFAVVVKNTGTAAAEKVRVSFVLPEHLQFVNAAGQTTFRHDAERRRVDFEPIESLAPRASARYEVTITAIKEGDARLQAELVSDSLSAEPVRREHVVQVFGSQPETTLGQPMRPPEPPPITPQNTPSK